MLCGIQSKKALNKWLAEELKIIANIIIPIKMQLHPNHSTKCSAWIISFNSHNALVRQVLYYSNFTEEDIETQRDWIICLRLNIQQVTELSHKAPQPQLETPSPGVNLGPSVILLYYGKQGSHHAVITSRVLLNEIHGILGKPAWQFSLKCKTVLMLPSRSKLREKWMQLY